MPTDLTLTKFDRRRLIAEGSNKRVRFPFSPITLAVKLENERIATERRK